jgi:nicotinamidase/pyrazinamidase
MNLRPDRLVFLDVDTQRDFMHPDGALPIPHAADIILNLDRLNRFARRHHIPIIATACAHTPEHPDPDPFPPHCLLGSPGQHRIPETHWGEQSVVLSIEDRFPLHQPLPPHLTLHKHRYDVFSRPDADPLLRRYAASGKTFVVYGVATEYCVRAAVLGLRQRHIPTAVVIDAIRPVDPSREPSVLQEFIEHGALLTLTDAICADPLPA